MHNNVQQNRVSRSVKTCTQMCMQNIGKLHKPTCNSNFGKSVFSDRHYRLQTNRLILTSIGLLLIVQLNIKLISTSDRRTDGQTSRTTVDYY